MAEVYHMVHYREFSHDYAAKKTQSLEQLARASLGAPNDGGITKWESIQDRVHDVPNGMGMQLLLNRVADLSDAVFGEMCLVHSHGLQALLELKATKHQLSTLTLAEIYSLTEQGAPEGMRFIRGLAYFLAIGNHLFFIRTQSLTPKYLQTYLEWLLKAQPGGLPATTALSLESQFDKSVVGEDIGDIKSLRVSGPTFPQMKIEPVNDLQTRERAITRKVADRFVEFAQAMNLAETLLGPARAKSLAESLGPKERLVVEAKVQIRGTRTETSRARMKSLASELDGLTDGKISVEGKDGRIQDQDVILRTSMPFEVPNSDTALLDFDNVADQLQKVYLRFVEDKKISS